MSDNASEDRGSNAGPNGGTRGTGGANLTPLVHRTGVRSGGSVSSLVVEAVAEAEGTTPADLADPLYDAVDPDALDRLFETGGGAGGRVEFSYADYRVTVTVDDDVYVYVYAGGPEP